MAKSIYRSPIGGRVLNRVSLSCLALYTLHSAQLELERIQTSYHIENTQ